MAQFWCCSLLQPDVGLRKGPAAAKRSRSQSESSSHLAATVTLPSLCWWVPTMEEMVIWEQHTVTLSKVSGLGWPHHGRRQGLWGQLCLTPLLPVPTRTLTGALDLLSLEAVTIPTG